MVHSLQNTGPISSEHSQSFHVFLSIGLMSGTSMDGIDGTLIKTTGTPDVVEPVCSVALCYTTPFKRLLKALEYAVRKYEGDLPKAFLCYPAALSAYLHEALHMSDKEAQRALKEMSIDLYGKEIPQTQFQAQDVINKSTDLHGKVVDQLLEKSGYQPCEIALVGYHGQTLYHQPQRRISVIVGNGQRLAQKTCINVITHFRQADVESGGQGAPFAPIYHQALAIRDNMHPAAIVNCGGIANITFVPTPNPQDLIAFDTGPGNGLIDAFVRYKTKGKYQMDKDGAFGHKGSSKEEVLEALWEKGVCKEEHNYFSLPVPKSLDIGDLYLIDAVKALSLEDGCATLANFTVQTITRSLSHYSHDLPFTWIVAGGGWKNPLIYNGLQQELSALNRNIMLLKAEAIGWDGAGLEAQIFAYLAVRSYQGLPLSYPGTTWVALPLTGGLLYTP